MNSSQNGGKSKSSKSSKSKKGGNFLGSVSELFVPTGWENFATAAGLLAIDRADAAFRRSRNSSKKQKGGADIDGHESIENMEGLMQELDTDSTDLEGPQQMNGGGRKTTKKSKVTKTKKSAAIKATKSTKKGGNFLGSVGELVAPTGWESFATTAGLFALDRADAALRRGTKEKKEKMKGGTICGSSERIQGEIGVVFDFYRLLHNKDINKYINIPNSYKKNKSNNFIISFIKTNDNKYSFQISGNIEGNVHTYCVLQKYQTLDEARRIAQDPDKQIILGKQLLRDYSEKRKNNKLPKNF